eukprot:TRINITY_DN80_c0_g2_i1.p1 TRINITY_DN80_c0_g2~~TRINITY_DN80_c0_g2_i1.p1  ORF type:complete len:224 (-),score=59.85 TRINITY_DN80_c0_g2_i1:106-777(-)
MKVVVVALLLALVPYLANAAYGVDISAATCSSGVTTGTWGCLKNAGVSFAIIEGWDGGYDYGTNTASCVANAWAAGLSHVDIYIFICPNCGTSASSGVSDLINHLKSSNVRFGQLWFDIEQCSGCWNDAGSNVQFIQAAIAEAKALGVSCGIYSSEYEWSQTTGGSSAFTGLPIWYAHYDDNPNFSDWGSTGFGGWGSPAIKQYYDSGYSSCGLSVDIDWYPS